MKSYISLIIFLFFINSCFGQKKSDTTHNGMYDIRPADSYVPVDIIRTYGTTINIQIFVTLSDTPHFKILQKDFFQHDTAFKADEFYRLIVGDKYLYIDADSNMVITDSFKAIQTLLLHTLINWEDQLKVQEEYRNFIQASVDFSNQVPDIWRTNKYNCKWKEYYALIQKQGYITKTLKKPNKNPCK